MIFRVLTKIVMRTALFDRIGLEKLRANAPRWHAALRAGRAAAPRCEAVIRSTGKQCCVPAMRESRKLGVHRCHFHCHGSLRDEVDNLREARAYRQAQSTNTIMRMEGLATLASIGNRRLHRIWKIDPSVPGSTLLLGEHDERRVTAWLVDRNVYSTKSLPGSDRPPTARAIDRLRWAAYLALSGRLTPAAADRRVHVAIRDDGRWWGKVRDMQNDDPGVGPAPKRRLGRA